MEDHSATCLDNWLIRLEATTALHAFRRRIAFVALTSDRPAVPLVGGTFNDFGFEHLPVRPTVRAEGFHAG